VQHLGGTTEEQGRQGGWCNNGGPIKAWLATSDRRWPTTPRPAIGDHGSVRDSLVGERWSFGALVTSGRRMGNRGPQRATTSGRPLAIGRSLAQPAKSPPLPFFCFSF
jgi:hypothetical protein